MPLKVGIVFNYLQLPDVLQYPFVINKRTDDIVIKKGMFVYTHSIEGFLIGIVEKIVLLNEYFSDALTIKAYNNNSNPNILKGLFPSHRPRDEKWDFQSQILGHLSSMGMGRRASRSRVSEVNRIAHSLL